MKEMKEWDVLLWNASWLNEGNERVGRFAVECELANNEDVGLAQRGLLPPEKMCQVTIQGVVGTNTIRLSDSRQCGRAVRCS
jgi:hypothetical protein